MTAFRAGFGRADITPQIGHRLMGYGNRSHGSTGVHDRLWARASLLADERGQWAIVACDLRCLNAESVAEARAAIQAQCDIPPAHVFICTTHTHSGPHDRDVENWDRPLAHILAEAVQAATAHLQPAQVGSGFGLLYGYSINRRWLDRPVDPAVAVIRIDTEEGRPLGLITSFGCHPVVLGYDNLQISADWPGYAMTKLENTIGSDVTCLFLQGGGGNVNPVVSGVRQVLDGSRPVVSIGHISTYYGETDSHSTDTLSSTDAPYNIGERVGGTFAEVAELGAAFAAEAHKVYSTMSTHSPTRSLWSAQHTLDAAVAEEQASTQTDTLQVPAEIMLLAIDDIIILGQPGELFSETSVWWRTHLRALGYATPLVVGHANGWLSYLPEPEDFPEGGYEIYRAQGEGTHPHFQLAVRRIVRSLLPA